MRKTLTQIFRRRFFSHDIPRKALSLALSGLIAASCLATVAAPAEASSPTKTFAYDSGSGLTYHVYDQGIDWNRPVGVVFYFDGDYWTKDQSKVWDPSGNADLKNMADVAKSRNMLFVPVISPDTDPSGDGITWWQSRDSNGDKFRSFANTFINSRGIDRSRVWTAGYSGGAEFETFELGADRQTTWRNGGGSIMIGGGNTDGMQTPPNANARNMIFSWTVGYADGKGVSWPTTWSAWEAANNGYNVYKSGNYARSYMNYVSGDHYQYNFPGILNSSINNVAGGIADYYWSHGAEAKFGLAQGTEFRLRDGGSSQRFANNYDIYWTPSWGAHSVWWGGAIGAKYRADGYENAYGFPVSDEYSINYGGSLQRFRKANGQQYAIYWSSATGAHVLKEFGDINAAYAAHQWERGWGFPSTDETSFWWGSKQHFLNTQTGVRTVAYWSAETGTHTINEKGSIFAKWASLGDAGNLGFPTTDEGTFWNGSSQHYYNKKTGSRTAIYWSAATGAHTMNEKGAVYAKWASLGDVKALGFPTTDEYTDASGTVHVKFQEGEITWTASGGTKAIYSK